MAGYLGGRYTVNGRAYETGLRRVLNRLSDETKAAARATAVDVQNEARRLCPVDTGRLRSSIVHVVKDSGRKLDISIGTNVNYAADVEYGTAPHVIRPVNRKALWWPGAAHPVASVNHPGTHAQPFMGPALEQAPVFFSVNARRIRGGA